MKAAEERKKAKKEKKRGWAADFQTLANNTRFPVKNTA